MRYAKKIEQLTRGTLECVEMCQCCLRDDCRLREAVTKVPKADPAVREPFLTKHVDRLKYCFPDLNIDDKPYKLCNSCSRMLDWSYKLKQKLRKVTLNKFRNLMVNNRLKGKKGDTLMFRTVVNQEAVLIRSGERSKGAEDV